MLPTAVGAQALSRVTLGLDNPVGLAFDAKGNLYIANGLSDAVSRVGPSGGALTVFASGFKAPQAVAFDAAGNLYVAGGADTAIVKVAPNGAGTIFATGFSRPQGLAFDKSGNLYVADETAGTVSKVSPSGNVAVFAAGFSLPTALAFDATGNLYVANGLTGTVAKVTPAAEVSVFAQDLAEPDGLAFDVAGNLYVAEAFGDQVSKITPDGTATVFAVTPGPAAGLAFDAHGNLFVGGFTGAVTKISPAGMAQRFVPILDGPTAMVRDAQGNLLIANSGSNEIDKVAANGRVTRFVSGFTELHGLALDKAGNLYAADAGANLVSKITPAGVASTFAAGIDRPKGLAFDSKGNLYVATNAGGGSEPGLIDRISPAGKVSNFVYLPSFVPDALAIDPANNLYVSAGSLQIYRVKPNATYALFDTGFGGIAGLSVDADGNLYVADSSTGQVFEIAPSGTATTLASDLRLSGLLYGGTNKVYVAGTDNAIALLNPGAKPPGSAIAQTRADQNNAYFTRNSNRPTGGGNCSYDPTVDILKNYLNCLEDFSPPSIFRVDLGFDANGNVTRSSCFQPNQETSFFVRSVEPFRINAVRSYVSEASPPLVAISQVAHTATNSPVTIDLANGSTGEPASAVPYGTVAGGSLKGFPGTTVTFTPRKDFAGLASFRYRLGTGACASAVATAYIGVGSTVAGPIVTSLTPSSGPRAGGANVTISGKNLLLAKAPVQVMFGTTAAKVVSSSAVKLVVQAPANFAGTVDVTVATPGGVSTYRAADVYTYK